jgi:hypothetical protein
MFQWYDVSPQITNRVVPKKKDVSPCSEYTRYTVEGILKDPRSELSALLDVHSMGPIFKYSSFKDPKWSEKLGYGMAVVGEDTRVHIHRNGKYIIRRALDREHAEDTYKTIVNMMRPAIFDEQQDRFMWDLVREITLDESVPVGIEEMLKWPGDEVDLKEVVLGIRKGASGMDKELLSGIRNDIIAGATIEREAISEQVHDLLKITSSELLDRPDISLGRYSASIWGLRVLDILDRTDPTSLKGLEDWSLEELKVRLGEGMGSLSTYQVHYLLAPVISI